MRLPFAIAAVLTSAWLALEPGPAFGWNRTGHRVIALIAYRQLDAPTRQKAAALLRKTPGAYDLWNARRINSETDPDADAFMHASTFADDVRPPSYFSREFHHSNHHYVTFRYIPGDPAKCIIEPEPDEENLLTTYRANLLTVRDAKGAGAGSDAKRGLALSWIFHQEGDIHQPLHALSRYSKTFPDGDRGGNLVTPFPNPRGSRPYSKSLHAYWDDLLGDDDVVKSFDEVDQKVNAVLSEFPRSKFSAAELGEKDVRVWALESLDAARKTAYRDLDPDIKSFAELPVAYEAEAQRLARRRIALAGYRLAEVLKGLLRDGE